MASTLKNGPAPTAKLVRGRPFNLGVITAANDAVQFSLPSDTFVAQGGMVIEVVGGTTPTCVLEASLDGAVTWFLVTLPTVITTAGFGDTSTTATFAPINVNGFGGATFRFGRTDANGGNANVWVLVG
jgi:hypothetical protein